MAVSSASSPGERIFSCRFREQTSAQKIGGSSEPQHRRSYGADQREGDLDDAGRQTHREPDPPSQIVGAERVADQAATVSADKAMKARPWISGPIADRM